MTIEELKENHPVFWKIIFNSFYYPIGFGPDINKFIFDNTEDKAKLDEYLKYVLEQRQNYKNLKKLNSLLNKI